MLLRLIRQKKLYLYFLEAYMELVFCKLLLLCVPFSKLVKNYGYAYCETFHNHVSDYSNLVLIQRVLKIAVRFLPWKSNCLDQAMAAQRMLCRRKLANTLYFGLSKQIGREAFVAHAWLRCGEHYIVGYTSQMQYTIVGSYAWF